MSRMGLPRQLTEKQMKFAELLVYNEGRKSASECAYEAGYKTRPRQAASELRNPKISPLVVRYIGELRQEIQEKPKEKHVHQTNTEFWNAIFNVVIGSICI